MNVRAQRGQEDRGPGADRLWRGGTRASCGRPTRRGGRPTASPVCRGDWRSAFAQAVLEDIHPRDSLARREGLPRCTSPWSWRRARLIRCGQAGGRCGGMNKQYQVDALSIINGKDVEQTVDVRASLTDMLRNDFRLTIREEGLRGGGVRRLHRPHRRGGLQLLHLPGRVGRGQAHPHAGGPAGPERRAQPTSSRPLSRRPPSSAASARRASS